MNTRTKEMQEIIDEFSLFGDWEDRYSYLIDLGKKIVPLEQKYKTDSYKVIGCASQVWFKAEKSLGDQLIVTFKADSDAYIVKGLIALLLRIYSGKTPDQIKEIKITPFFEELGLKSHLSPNRSNGFFAMVQCIYKISINIG
jgi:cysteine desulfuration protein SufE|tara:strand:+ start:461 stop:886 length:426 start_codon:yes stop_codon:yes gene_type:complete